MPRRESSAVEPADGYHELREAILSGQYQPNERLVEADLVESLGIPRGAVRLALIQLAHDGLVVRERNRGARVRRVSVDEAIQILQARAALEGFAAREAAKKATADEIAQMQATLEETRALLDAGDLLGASERNPELHRAILTAARHETIERLVASLSSQLVRFQFRTILAPGRAEASYGEHSAVVEAIAASDPDAAEAAMRTHLSGVADALVNVAEKELARS
jgi:DNA-binding GntR family transcriptional regulator